MPYTIKPMPPAEIPDWHRWMQEIQQGMADTSRFVVDPLAYLLSHMENGGFGLQVVDEVGEKAACLICCVPQTAEENLGSVLFSDPEELARVLHVEYAAVEPAHRGNRLQERLIAEAESCLTGTRFVHLMATASPENPASVRSFLHEGYRIIETKPMYGGLLRHIFYKSREQRQEAGR